MTYDDDQIDRLRLYRTENVGPVVFRQLLGKYGNAKDAIQALGPLSRSGGRKKPLKATPRATIIEEIAAMEKAGATFIFANEENYPKILWHINDAPPVIACLGHPHLLNKPQIAIVGARNASSQARKLAYEFAKALGQKHDYVITSGMARGIDSAAHEGSLKSGGVAVLAGGVDCIYPPENSELYKSLKNQGCIISEVPFGIAPMARHFPRRNRLIAGLALGVLIIEAALKSGSLITARLAGDYGREVFAVPGSPLDPRCRGCNKLLRDGATLTETPEDIIAHLTQHNVREGQKSPRREMPLFEIPDAEKIEDDNEMSGEMGGDGEKIYDDLRKRVLQLLSPTPCDIDSVIRDSEADTKDAITVLMELELAGKAERYPGNRIALSLEAAWQNDNDSF